MENRNSFSYSSQDLVREPVEWTHVWKELTEFDQALTKGWDDAVSNGLFRYTLDGCSYKVLDIKSSDDPFSLPCVAQLNPQRAVKRRKRGDFETMNDMFDANQFNFTKINQKEVLMIIMPRKQTAEFLNCSKDDSSKTCWEHEILLNVSPIGYGHILFAPYLRDCLPQQITKGSLLLAFDIVQLSSQPGFRLSFNSLHAWASINHQHFHGMYCQYELFADIIPAERKVAGTCFLLDKSSPISGFAFMVPDDDEMRYQVASDITVVTGHLHRISIPYNIIINRGKPLLPSGGRSSQWATRLLLWPRKSTKGLEPSPAFDVACIEVGGHFPIKTEGCFDNLTPDEAKRRLREAALEKLVFSEIVDSLKTMLD